MMLVVPSANADDAKQSCPMGFRLHYQGFCINLSDEQKDDPQAEIRTVEPFQEPEHNAAAFIGPITEARIAGMTDRVYCRNAFLAVSGKSVAPASAIAFGSESCGVSSPGSASVAQARASAIEKCAWSTTDCSIVLVVTD